MNVQAETVIEMYRQELAAKNHDLMMVRAQVVELTMQNSGLLEQLSGKEESVSEEKVDEDGLEDF